MLDLLVVLMLRTRLVLHLVLMLLHVVRWRLPLQPGRECCLDLPRLLPRTPTAAALAAALPHAA